MSRVCRLGAGFLLFDSPPPPKCSVSYYDALYLPSAPWYGHHGSLRDFDFHHHGCAVGSGPLVQSATHHVALSLGLHNFWRWPALFVDWANRGVEKPGSESLMMDLEGRTSDLNVTLVPVADAFYCSPSNLLGIHGNLACLN